jgi:hypothetical protein
VSQHLLTNKTKNEYEYDREQALRIYHLIRDEIVADSTYAAHVSEYEQTTDDDRIIALFEMLNESLFGDCVFHDLANFDQGSYLTERGDDE